MNREPLTCAVCGARLEPGAAFPTIRRANGEGAGWVCREVEPCLARRCEQMERPAPPAERTAAA